MEFKRIFIEKKEEFNTEGQLLLKDFKDYLEIKSLTKVRTVNVYDLMDATEEEMKLIVNEILFEETLDNKYENNLPIKANERLFRVEYLRGQYNQREDSTNQMIRM